MSWFPSKDKTTRPGALASAAVALPLKAAPTAGAGTAVLSPRSTALAVEQHGGATDGKSYHQFGDLPHYSRVLTGGESPVISLSLTDKKQAVAVELSANQALVLATNDSSSEGLKNQLRGKLLSLGYKVEFALIGATLLKQVYGDDTGASLIPINAKSEFQRTFQEWVTLALENRASDLHLEVTHNVGNVRLRVDGEMELLRNSCGGIYPAELVRKVISQIFTEGRKGSNSASTYTDSAYLYCMIPYSAIPGHKLNLRYQSLPGAKGPKAVLRLLSINEAAHTQSFYELGYAPSQIKILEEAAATPTGIVLIAGITNSGKSTSLKSFIENSPYAAISAVYSIEDPVEQPLKGVHQIQLQRDASDTASSTKAFRSASTALVRSDPDAAILGEIRDKYGASAMQEIAETGHMALGTVHAHLIAGVVPRLVNEDIGMSRSTLTSPNMLTLIVYQALVPVLCPHCALTAQEILATPDEKIAHTAIEGVQALSLPISGLRFKKIGGCAHCQNRGTTGMTVVAEMLLPDERWLLPTREGRDVEAENARRLSSDGNLQSFNMDGKTVFHHTLHKALNGTTDVRQCHRFNTWAKFKQQHEADNERRRLFLQNPESITKQRTL